VHLATLTAIRPELESELTGQLFGKVFQLSKYDVAVDFRLMSSRYLFVSIQPGNPRIYLIKRRLRDLEKASVNPAPFSLAMRKYLSGSRVSAITQIESERVLLITLEGDDDADAGDRTRHTLAIQLTGSSSNMFLLDSGSVIIGSLKHTRGEGQQPGDPYLAPERRSAGDGLSAADTAELPPGRLSERLDSEDLARSAGERVSSIANNARSKLRQEVSKRTRLIKKLKADLAAHGDADEWKRLGDLLLANVKTARRDVDKVFVTDYFDSGAPEISVEIDRNESLTGAAEGYFRKYTKARNARTEIAERLRIAEKELAGLKERAERLEEVIASGDEDSLLEFTGDREKRKQAGRRKEKITTPGVRTFISSDGLEILVGKKAKDNDFLTFRIAKSLDIWMHAADYPGSHVVIRNPNRKDVPQSTMIEAAQLAAFYSQGKKQTKAAVHHTQKKFVNKPKGAAPGLVSLASFKTLLVEPKIGNVTARKD
jgi:predicted ribosome quality control (RQC) complex YloA/Tae2 family protein